MSTQNVIQPPVANPPAGGSPTGNGPAAPVPPQAAIPNGAPVATNGSHVPVATAVPVQSVPAAPPVPQPVVAAPVTSTPAAATPVAATPAPIAAAPVAPVQTAPPVAAAPQAAPAPTTPVSAATSPQPQPATKKPAAARQRLAVAIVPRVVEQKRDWKMLSTVMFISAGMHGLALLTLTLFVISNPQVVEELFTAEVEDTKEVVEEPIVEHSMEQPEDTKEVPQEDVSNNVAEMVFDKGPANININDLPAAQVKVEGEGGVGLADINFGNAASGRMSASARASLVRSMGGNSASEAAVAYGMRWISKHQFNDGGWSFQHDDHSDCKGQCSQPGSLKGGRTGATGLALLAFLGGGHTHQTGEYQKEVKGGIEFLLKNGQPTPQGFDLCPTVVSNEKMYIQGLCTIALSELAALTNDKRVKNHAQEAVKFIIAGQNPKSGGWRYVPYPTSADPGDTSVVGWQVMALKSAKNAKLNISNGVFKGAEMYLNSAQANGGSQYAYDLSGDKRAGTPTMTAAGLLCRMYLGWDRKNKALQEGVKYLAAAKPAPNNMYYNYYATQVMHHWGGDEWSEWNTVMRDQLIRTQKTAKDGHMQGSWDLADVHGAVGGRLYMSCLCVMTLEVYYRHLPIYRREGLKVEF